MKDPEFRPLLHSEFPPIFKTTGNTPGLQIGRISKMAFFRNTTVPIFSKRAVLTASMDLRLGATPVDPGDSGARRRSSATIRECSHARVDIPNARTR
jgi:hypothetical protein